MRVARRAAIVLASLALACGAQAMAVAADGPGDSSGSGSTDGAPAATSACAASGMTDVAMLGTTVFLGLPFTVDLSDPSNPQLALRDAVVCTDVPGQSGELVDQAVVVQVPNGQGSSPGVTCTPQGAATVGPQCAAVVAVQAPAAGASGLGLSVSLPLTLCVASTCQTGSANLATAVVTGMLQCTSPPGSGGPVPTTGGTICQWQGAQLTADGVPLPTPTTLSTGGVAGGAWVTPHVSVDIGFASVLAGCEPQTDPSGCVPQPDDAYAVVRAGGGRVLLLVVPGQHDAVVMPVAIQSCIQPHGTGHC
jgi:hypothetical protein